MIIRFVRWFDHGTRTDRSEIGGKCANLGELLRAGIAVPNGFTVTVDAFESLCDSGDLRARLGQLLDDVDPADAVAVAFAHQAATALVRATPVPDDVARQVRAAYAELGLREGWPDLPVAVRSSTVAEDGDNASFAGQQETYLYTVGLDDVLTRLRDCWASLYTPQAIAYRARLPREQRIAATRMAVGVQAMVDATTSGVAFTVSPRTGDRSVIAVNASWGLGQAVVSGEVTPDEFWLSKAGPTITRRTVVRKARECRPADSGRGVVMVDVPPDRRDVACVDDAQLHALAALALRIEEYYGCPQDIEWALTADGRLLVLQSRPETTWRARRAETTARGQDRPGYLGVIQALGAGLARGRP
jgi:pyruvate,water dikinase